MDYPPERGWILVYPLKRPKVTLNLPECGSIQQVIFPHCRYSLVLGKKKISPSYMQALLWENEYLEWRNVQIR